MSLRLVLSARAEKEALTAARWYAQRSLGLDDRFRIALKNCLNAVLERPWSFPTVAKGVRQARVKVFPFVVVYKTFAEEVFVISVFHERRDPGTKLRVLKGRRR